MNLNNVNNPNRIAPIPKESENNYQTIPNEYNQVNNQQMEQMRNSRSQQQNVSNDYMSPEQAYEHTN